MLSALFWFTVGIFIGWNFPQPAYAKAIQDWIVLQWKKVTNKTNSGE